ISQVLGIQARRVKLGRGRRLALVTREVALESSSEGIMTPSLRACNAGCIDNTEIRCAQTGARRRRPLARPCQRAATESFPAAGRPRALEPAPPGDFQVPQLTLSLEQVIPSDLRHLEGQMLAAPQGEISPSKEGSMSQARSTQTAKSPGFGSKTAQWSS